MLTSVASQTAIPLMGEDITDEEAPALNGTHSLTFPSLSHSLSHSLTRSLARSQIEALFDEADKDKSGHIDFKAAPTMATCDRRCRRIVNDDDFSLSLSLSLCVVGY